LIREKKTNGGPSSPAQMRGERMSHVFCASATEGEKGKKKSHHGGEANNIGGKGSNKKKARGILAMMERKKRFSPFFSTKGRVDSQ